MARNFLDELLGLGEAGLTLGTGAVAGAVGMPYGLFKGITGGGYGTRQGVEQAQREAQAFMERNTYQPRTEAGQGLLQSLGKAMEASKLPPVVPEAMLLASIPRAAAAAQTERLGMAAERALEAPLQRAYDKGGLTREMLLAMGQNTVSPATVWHGSPHLFQRFDASKMGTGEGAQAYGQGLYLAEARDVGKSYAPRDLAFEQKLMGAYKNAERSGDYASLQVLEEFMTHRTPSEVQETLSQFSGKDAANAKRTFDMASKAFQNQKGSYLYQVDLPDEQIAKMLDYDKPLSKQPPAVQAWLRSPYNAYRNQLTAKDVGGNEPTGVMILGKLQELMSGGKKNDVFTNAANFGAANASRELMEAGIPGIRYLDEGSRGAGKGTSNFVVFPGMEDMLRIEQINEQPINSLLQTLGR
jgi:hypothetical protein